jgi:hypothetical protein
LLSSVDWEADGGALGKRFSPTRSPNDDKLLQMACSALFSYSAKHGFDGSRFYEAKDELLAKMVEYIDAKAYELIQSFEQYVEDKIALRRRQYNTAINDPEQEAKRQAKEVEAQARAYRKASGS